MNAVRRRRITFGQLITEPLGEVQGRINADDAGSRRQLRIVLDAEDDEPTVGVTHRRSAIDEPTPPPIFGRKLLLPFETVLVAMRIDQFLDRIVDPAFESRRDCHRARLPSSAATT